MYQKRELRFDKRMRQQARRTARRSSRRPWWLRLVASAGVAFVLIGLYLYLPGAEEPAPVRPVAAAATTHTIPVDLPLAPESAGAPAAMAGHTAPDPVEPTPEAAPMGPTTVDSPAATPEPPGRWVEIEVRPGDSLSTIFNRNQLSIRALHEILESDPDAVALRRIKPGQLLRVRVHDGAIEELVHERDLVESLRCVRDGDQFLVDEVRAPTEVEIRTRSGVISSSLFLAGQEAGITDKLIMQLAGIFGWDIDFVLDIRKNDRFSVVYEEHVRDGQRIREGHILAAEFINQGRRFRAVRYTNAAGETDYYAEDGRSMRKAFLRTPVNFTRISSRFNLRRRHPVLNTIRAHRGVDYAAPHGTPVKSTGDGVIHFAGRNGGYGKMVQIRHGSTYSTVYAHLTRFARGIRPGKAVAQGQTIGYVGQSGLATGPHLHYEFRVNDAHRDPLKVEFPQARPIPQAELARFQSETGDLLARLDRIRDGETRIAAADEKTAGTEVAEL